MTRRSLAAVAAGVVLAVLALAVACSAIDPNPPNPHQAGAPIVEDDAADASDAAVQP